MLCAAAAFVARFSFAEAGAVSMHSASMEITAVEFVDAFTAVDLTVVEQKRVTFAIAEQKEKFTAGLLAG